MTHPLVSRSKHRIRVTALCLVSALVGLMLTAGVAGPAYAVTYSISYNGGEVMTGHEKVYLVLWGSQWGGSFTNAQGDIVLSNDPAGAAPVLQEFFKGLGTGGETWSSIMTQYCQGVPVGTKQCSASALQAGGVGYPTGGALAGVWADNAAAAPVQATLGQVASEAAAAAAHFGNTTAASNNNAVYMVVSPTGTNSPVSEHSWINSRFGPLAYINLPYVSDHDSADWTVITGPAGLFTRNASHEYAETITDPQASGGWYDPTIGGNSEVGDPCEGDAQSFGLQLTTGMFWVQSVWSNAAGGCVGGNPGPGILNGTFTNAYYDWAATGAFTIATDPQTNTQGLLLGSPTIGGTVEPTTGDSMAEQRFTVPPGDNWLSFSFKQNCTDSHGAVGALLLDQTNLASPSGQVLNGYTCVSNGGWMLVTAPVTPGHYYSLQFHNQNQDLNTGNTMFQNVQLSATQPGPVAPGGIQLVNECNFGWIIYWNPVPGAATYNIYANGVLIAGGLTSGYYGYGYPFTTPLNEWYTVTAVSATGVESQPSATVINPFFDQTAC